MRRRPLLATVGVLGSGCLSRFTMRESTSPTAQSRLERDGLTATVADVTYDGTAGANEERVSLSVDCESRTATLSGWLSTSSCRTVAIQSLRYDATERHAELVLYPRWTESDPPENVDCAGASYRYLIDLQAERRLPTTVRVSYEYPEREGTSYILQVQDCS